MHPRIAAAASERLRAAANRAEPSRVVRIGSPYRVFINSRFPIAARELCAPRFTTAERRAAPSRAVDRDRSPVSDNERLSSRSSRFRGYFSALILLGFDERRCRGRTVGGIRARREPETLGRYLRNRARGKPGGNRVGRVSVAPSPRAAVLPRAIREECKFAGARSRCEMRTRAPSQLFAGALFRFARTRFRNAALDRRRRPPFRYGETACPFRLNEPHTFYILPRRL